MRICKRELEAGPYGSRRHSSFAMSENGVVTVAPADDDENDENSDDEGGIPRDNNRSEEDEGVELRTYSTSFDEGHGGAFVGAGPGHIDDNDDNNSNNDSLIFNKSDRVEIVRMMHSSLVLNDAETVIIELLVDQEDPHIDDAFLMYESSKDVFTLTTTLKRVAQAAGELLAGDIEGEMGRGSQDYDEESEEEEEEESEEEEEEEEDDDSSSEDLDESTAYDVFLAQVDAMDLNEVSERSERASRKTSILAMNPAKWLQA